MASPRALLLAALACAALPGARGVGLPLLGRFLPGASREPPALATVASGEAERRRKRLMTTLTRDDVAYRAQSAAPCSRTLLFVNVGLFALQLLTRGRLTAAGCKPARAFRLADWPRLFTPVFLHGSIVHLAVNSYSLNDLGPVVEQAFGSSRFMLTYALAGIAGNILSFQFNTRATSVGASGAIFGLVGAYASYLALNNELLGERGSVQLQSLGTMIMLNLG